MTDAERIARLEWRMDGLDRDVAFITRELRLIFEEMREDGLMGPRTEARFEALVVGFEQPGGRRQ